MGEASNRHNTKQDKHAAACRRSGKMAVLTLCGMCDKPVVGVVVGKRGRYAVECKRCGYSAMSRFEQRA